MGLKTLSCGLKWRVPDCEFVKSLVSRLALIVVPSAFSDIAPHTVSKHNADSRSIMVFPCFIGVFAVLFLFSPANFVGSYYFNLDFHRADAAD
jgi:hypothetical protein